MASLFCWPSDGGINAQTRSNDVPRQISFDDGGARMSWFDPDLKDELEAAYLQSLADELWTGSEMATSKEAYLSILAKIYFDAGQRSEAVDLGIRNRVELEAYDPAGYAVTDKVFRKDLWPGSRDDEIKGEQPLDEKDKDADDSGEDDDVADNVDDTPKEDSGKEFGFDLALKSGLEQAYLGALERGLWEGSEIVASKEDYLALTAKIYFDPAQRPEAVALGIETRADLQGYDPDGFAVLEAVFGTQTTDTEAVMGGESDDVLEGQDGDDMLIGFDGADQLKGGKGADKLDGGDGFDVASFEANRKDISVTLEKDAAVKVSDRTGQEGSDLVANIEQLDFMSGDALDLNVLIGVTQLDEANLTLLVELYVAYFNRAPDAEGLFFWGGCLHDGMTFPEIAKAFFDQPETVALYGDGSDAASLVTQVYNNFLGRDPDASGFSYWTDVLEQGGVTPDVFILAVIDGAKAATGSDVDVAYFTDKAKIGAYFSVTLGLNNAETAQDIMALFDGSRDSMIAAKDATDAAFDVAVGAEDGEFVMNLVGVMADPLVDM